jgi:tRNA threonylcarbamoyladenosine biosynthesis protein TsaB
MKILGLDTSNKKSSIALTHNDELIAYDEGCLFDQAETIIPKISDMLSRSGLSFKDIDQIAASVGPGSFTGIRIGLSTARAIAFSANIPAVAVNNFETIIYRAKRQINNCDVVIAMIDAYRNQIYVSDSLNFCGQRAINISEIENYLGQFKGQKIISAGSGAIFAHEYCETLPRFPFVDARFVCKLAYEKIMNKKIMQTLDPLYIREADAKPSNVYVPFIAP